MQNQNPGENTQQKSIQKIVSVSQRALELACEEIVLISSKPATDVMEQFLKQAAEEIGPDVETSKMVIRLATWLPPGTKNPEINPEHLKLVKAPIFYRTISELGDSGWVQLTERKVPIELPLVGVTLILAEWITN